MRAPPLLLPALVAAFLAGPVDAGHFCETYSTSAPEIDTQGQLEERYYVEYVPPCQPECLPGPPGVLYLYEEANGIDGLQRADEWEDDTCHGLVPPDALRAATE
jgi:hypothetical protein